MSSRLFLLLSLILALFQGPLLPLVFAEGLLIIFYLWSNNFDKNFVWPFVAGLIFDLVQDQHLGVSSLIFLITAVLLKNLRAAIPLQKPIVLTVIVLVIYVIRGEILFGQIKIVPVIFVSLITYLLFTVVWGGRKEIRVG